MNVGGGVGLYHSDPGRAIRNSMGVIRGSMPSIVMGMTNEAQINGTLGFVAELEMV